MRAPPFDHARILADAWKDGPPRHNLGSSGFIAPPTTMAADPGGLDLQATDLQQALARRAGVPADHLTVTAGTTGANSAALLALVVPGLPVACETPFYAPLPGLAAHLGADVSFHPLEDLLDGDWDARLVLLTSPNNPTARTLTRAELDRLHAHAEAKDARVLVDQVYAELTDAPKAIGPRFLATSGMNKCWGAPGLRIGWAIGPDAPLVHQMHLTTHLAPGHVGQSMALELLAKEPERAAALRLRLSENHRLYKEFALEHGFAPAAGLVTFPRLGLAWQKAARAAGILVLPGAVFGAPEHARIGLGAPPAAIEAALHALSAVA